MYQVVMMVGMWWVVTMHTYCTSLGGVIHAGIGIGVVVGLVRMRPASAIA